VPVDAPAAVAVEGAPAPVAPREAIAPRGLVQERGRPIPSREAPFLEAEQEHDFGSPRPGSEQVCDPDPPGLITPGALNVVYARQSESQYQGTLAWAAADKHVTNDARMIPIGAGTTLGFTSKRVGNYQIAPAPGNAPIVDQMWVR